MPWYYEPSETPPTVSMFENNEIVENVGAVDNEYEFEGNRDKIHNTSNSLQRSNSSNNQLLRRMSALFSPLNSVPQLPGPLASIAKSCSIGSSSPQFSPFPHPSYESRYEPQIPSHILNSTSFDEHDLFFYPRRSISLKGYKSDSSPLNATNDELDPHVREGDLNQDISNSDKNHNIPRSPICLTNNENDVHANHEISAHFPLVGFGSENRLEHNEATEQDNQVESSHQSHHNSQRVNKTQHSQYGHFYPETSSKQTRTKQTKLVQNSNCGELNLMVPQDTERWPRLGEIEANHDETGETDGNVETATITKKKKKNKKKKKKRPMPDIRAMISPKVLDDVANSKEIESKDENEDDIVQKKKPRKKSGEQKRKKRSSDNIETTNVDEKPQPITEQMLNEFAEYYEVKNAGANSESLSMFLRLAKAQVHVSWTIIFHDRSCTTPFLPSTKKYCTKKGPKCTHWNCSCDKQIRAMQASAPLVGAMFVFPMDNDDKKSVDCFLLPLGPTTDPDDGPKDLDAGYERMAQWPFLPILCNTTLQQRWDTFQSILLDKHLICVTFNAQLGLMPYHYHCVHDVVREEGKYDGNESSMNLVIPRLFDVRLASWMLSPRSVEKDLEFEINYAGFPHLRVQNEPSPPNASEQMLGLIEAKEKLQFLYALYPIVNNLLDSNGLKDAFEDIESPIQSILSSMEFNGIGFEAGTLLQIQTQVESRIKTLSAEAREIAQDQSFNLSSPQQVSQLLFDRMGIIPPKMASRKSAPELNHQSTSEEVLKSIQATGKKLRIIEVILEFRSLSKMLNTYILPYPQLARTTTDCYAPLKKKKRTKKKEGKNENSIKIFPMWMQTAVRTGRLSCRKPNMQQIPTTTFFGICPRTAFISSCKETCLFAFDYCQNEVRILAHMSGDDSLISLFNTPGNVDIYKQMSSVTSGKPVDQITDKERAVSKQVTLAILYGMGLPQVAKKLGVDRTAAKAFFDSFYGRFRGVKAWMNQTKSFAREHKYVKTITGRRRYLDNIVSDNEALKKQAERQAVNSVIQGSAADVMKLAMLKIASRLTDWRKEASDAGGTGMAPKMLLQLHDELVIELMSNKADLERLTVAVKRCCAEECEQELHLRVP